MGEPYVVGTSSTSIRSFTETGTPCKTPRTLPERSSSSARAASRRASPARTCVYAFTSASLCSMRVSNNSSRPALVSSPDRSRSAMSRIGRNSALSSLIRLPPRTDEAHEIERVFGRKTSAAIDCAEEDLIALDHCPEALNLRILDRNSGMIRNCLQILAQHGG